LASTKKRFQVISRFLTTGHYEVLDQSDNPAEALKMARERMQSRFSRITISAAAVNAGLTPDQFAQTHKLR
jgi:hypothetical protein